MSIEPLSYTDIEKERAIDFLCSAVEGGINYWATVRNYRWAGDRLEGLPFEQVQVEVIDSDEADDDGASWTLVTAEMIAATLRLVAERKTPVFFNDGYDHPLFLRLLMAEYGRQDDFDFDASDADAVLQLAAFENEIIYG